MDQIRGSIATDKFGKFLYKVLLQKCLKEDRIVKISPKPKLKFFPPVKTEQFGYSSTIEQVINILKTDRPVLTESICTVMKNNECVEGHATVISGYKKVCKASGSPCRDLIKIHESGGTELQKKLNGGWIDAESMFNRLTGYQDLAWLEDP